MALISVVAVLVLLAIIATPFLVTMRDSAARGERFLYSARADWEAESLFELVRTHLTASLEHVERRKLDEEGTQADSGTRPPDSATPTSDTPSEFVLPESLLARFNRTNVSEQRVWDVEITDLQSRLNLNGCSYPVLANILGRSELSDTVTTDDDSIPLTDASMFPPDGGVVRVGSEVIKYKEVSGSALTGCERGFRSDLPENGTAGEWQAGDVVVLEAAFQIATRPFRARAGAYVRYTNPYQIRTIGEQGVAALGPTEFDRLRPLVTAWSGNVVGDGWSNPQVVRNAIGPGDATQLYAELKNVRYFGPGTLVKLTDGSNSDYAVVTQVRGSNQVLLAGKIEHNYSGDQARLYSLARAPVNVNTADVGMLTHIFDGLRIVSVGTAIPRETARRLAEYIKSYTVEGETNPGVYRNWQDFVTMLDQARQEERILDDASFSAVLLNAMNSNDSALAFSTVPFTFRSFDTYEVRATAAIMDGTGRELARREFRRVLVASSTTSATYVVETQSDFQNQIMKSRDGKWFATFPQNINAYFDGPNIPASEFRAFAQKSRFPDTDTSAAVGHVALLPAAFRYYRRRAPDRVHHFDDSDLPEGLDLDEQDFDVGLLGPYSVSDRNADLVKYVDVDGIGSDLEVGLNDFALSFWYQPKWARDEGEQVIFDCGSEGTQFNRVGLRYVTDHFSGGGDALILSVADASREARSTEVVYRFDHTTWDTENWYHIGVHVGGTHASQVELFIDGEKQGQATGITRLSTSVPPTGDVSELRVVDASTFPDDGVLLVRGQDGAELFEYRSHSSSSFSVTRRKARSIDRSAAADVPRGHNAGDVVELYGFSAPLYCDLKPGGATVSQGFGPFRVYRFVYEQDELRDQAGRFIKGLAEPAAGTSGSIPDIQLQEWDTGSTTSDLLDDLPPDGFALIVSNAASLSPQAPAPPGGGPAPTAQWLANGTNASNEQQSKEIGTTEIVRYSVSNASTGMIELTARHVKFPNVTVSDVGADGLPRFIPTYCWGDSSGASTNLQINSNSTSGNVVLGAYTAFIPIALSASGGSADYLDPRANEGQLGGKAYVQVDSEWIKYDTFDSTLFPGRVSFLATTTLDNVQWLFAQSFHALAVDQVGSSQSPLSGQKGGSGGNASEGYTPQPAQDGNDENALPKEPTSSGSGTFLAPVDEVDAFTIAKTLDFRGMILPSRDLDFRIANTIPANHTTGADVIPTFKVVCGNSLERDDDPSRRGAFPGFNDLLTLRDANLNDEFVRAQWGYNGWVGLTQPASQLWNWDRPDLGKADLQRYDSRVWTRLIKFPSGELPDAGLTTGAEKLLFGRSYDGATKSSALIDEVFFPEFTRTTDDRRDHALLGEVPQELINQQVNSGNPNANGQPVAPQFIGIDDEQDEIHVHMLYYDTTVDGIIANGLPIDDKLFPDDGGVIRIDDELILYSDFDPATGAFTGCVRGTFGTAADTHQFSAIVSPIHTFPASRLLSDSDETSASFQLEKADDFPDDGCLRIADRGEIAGYTERIDNNLSGPLGRIDPTTEDTGGTGEARVGGALFRGRFGTTAEGYVVDDVAIAMPFRYYDRYAERSDDAENSYVQLTWTRPGAIWKRITWTEQPRNLVEVIALVRFAGGPAWDSADVVRVGQQQLPQGDRSKFVYEISDPSAENLLNVESDRVEVRLMVRFAAGAYDRFAAVAPDNWKQTPWIQKVVAEYVAPPVVIYEDK